MPQSSLCFSALVPHKEANENSNQSRGFELCQVSLCFSKFLLVRRMAAILISMILAICIPYTYIYILFLGMLS